MDAKFHLSLSHGCYEQKCGQSYNILKTTDVFIKKEESVQNSDCTLF